MKIIEVREGDKISHKPNNPIIYWSRGGIHIGYPSKNRRPGSKKFDSFVIGGTSVEYHYFNEQTSYFWCPGILGRGVYNEDY